MNGNGFENWERKVDIGRWETMASYTHRIAKGIPARYARNGYGALGLSNGEGDIVERVTEEEYWEYLEERGIGGKY